MTNFQPDGWPTIIPRVFTEDVRGVVGFLKLVFGAHGEMRIGAPAEMRIGDSLILVSDGGAAREARKTFLYVCVENTDKTYGRALEGRRSYHRETRRHALWRSTRHGAGPVGQYLANCNTWWRIPLVNADYSATMSDRSSLIRRWVASTIPRMMSAAGWIALTRPTDCPARRLIDAMSPVVWAFGGRLAKR